MKNQPHVQLPEILLQLPAAFEHLAPPQPPGAVGLRFLQFVLVIVLVAEAAMAATIIVITGTAIVVAMPARIRPRREIRSCDEGENRICKRFDFCNWSRASHTTRSSIGDW